MKIIISYLIILSFLLSSASLTLAQTTPQKFEAEMIVTKPDGKSSEEIPIMIILEDNQITFESVKRPTLSKSFLYNDIKSAEYTYNKKPRYTTGAVLAMAVSVFLLPLMFTKSKKHWMTIQTGSDYTVLKLKKSNYRIFMPALETKGVKVTDLGDQNKKDDDKKEKSN